MWLSSFVLCVSFLWCLLLIVSLINVAFIGAQLMISGLNCKLAFCIWRCSTFVLQRLDLSSIWALLAAFEDPLPLTFPFEGAFVKGVDALSWMANNSAKLSSTQGGPHCWTFFSTAAFGKQNKVPQVCYALNCGTF